MTKKHSSGRMYPPRVRVVRRWVSPSSGATIVSVRVSVGLVVLRRATCLLCAAEADGKLVRSSTSTAASLAPFTQDSPTPSCSGAISISYVHDSWGFSFRSRAGVSQLWSWAVVSSPRCTFFAAANGIGAVSENFPSLTTLRSLERTSPMVGSSPS